MQKAVMPMEKDDIRQYHFLLNMQSKEDKEIYEILCKQGNMSRFIKQSILYYYGSGRITVKDLKQSEDRIIQELKGFYTDSQSEKQRSDQRAEKREDMKNQDSKNKDIRELF